LGETGTVASFVVVHYVSITSFLEDVPYVVAHITLDGTDQQITMISNVIECPWEQVRVGMPMRVVFDDVTPEVTLPKFRPV
ncbi:MAG: Zn-ribbon domain-containing OB-fold protein, partial [Candidatus Binatia bacterium]